jgi:hypothetical protein
MKIKNIVLVFVFVPFLLTLFAESKISLADISVVVHDQGSPTPPPTTFTVPMCSQIGGCFPSVASQLKDNSYPCLGGGGIVTACTSRGDVGLNFYLTSVLSYGNNVISDGSNVCVGQPLQLSSRSTNSEWFSKGGPVDSPPVTFVSQDQLRNIILNANKKRASVVPNSFVATDIGSSKRPPSLMLPETIISDSDVVTGVTLYRSGLYSFPTNNFWYTYGTVFCSLNQSSSSFQSNTFVPTSPGEYNLDISYSSKCIFYLERLMRERCSNGFLSQVDFREGATCGNVLSDDQPAYDVLSLNFGSSTTQNSNQDFMSALSMAPLKSSIKLTAADKVDGANLVISPSSNSGIVKLSITNNGDSSAVLDDIQSQTKLSIQNKLPLVILPSQSVDVFATTNTDTSALTFTPVYTSNGVPCSSAQTTTSTTSTGSGSCSDNSQCTTNLCCEGQCRDPTQGACRDLLGNGVLKWIPFK